MKDFDFSGLVCLDGIHLFFAVLEKSTAERYRRLPHSRGRQLKGHKQNRVRQSRDAQLSSSGGWSTHRADSFGFWEQQRGSFWKQMFGKE